MTAGPTERDYPAISKSPFPLQKDLSGQNLFCVGCTCSPLPLRPAGAFHVSKPTDLIPELQGRFPIRVELKSLSREDFIRILKEPRNALVKQYIALLDTEGIRLAFTDDALEEVASFAAQVNEPSENIGARRLHTIMEKLLEEISFEGPDLRKKNVKVDAAYVRKQLADIVKDQDLSRYIL